MELSKLLNGEAIVLINRNDLERGGMIIQGAYGVDKTQLGKVFDWIGYAPVGHYYEADPEINALFKHGKLIAFEGGLVALAKHVILPPITRQLVRLLNLGEIYLIGLQKDGVFYAGIQFYMRGECTIDYPDLIEAFVGQASTALQRAQAEAALRESELRYRSLFEQSNDAVFILDLEGNHVQLNQRAADMLGYTPSELVGLSFREVVIPEEHHQSENVLEKLLAGKQVPPYERTFRRKDGTSIPVEVNVEVVWDAIGEPLHVQSIVRDISERKEEEQRRLLLELEQQRVQLITQFIQDTAHEFRTPLSVIKTGIYLMCRYDEAEKRKVKAEQIEDEIGRITRLIDMQLMMIHLENMRAIDIQHQTLNPQHTLEIVCRQIGEHYPSKAQLTLQINDKLPEIRGDTRLFNEMIGQVVDNAYRFTPKDGAIRVCAGVEGDQVWIVVKDTGDGIAEADLPHIFEVFWRLDASHSTPGFGLGLPIAQKIVHLHGGVIHAVSKLGVGTTVRITLPIGDPHAPFVPKELNA